MFRTQLDIREATHADRPHLQALLTTAERVHLHPDWQPPLDWLGTPPFIVAQQRQGGRRRPRIAAALAAAPDPPDTAWIRFAMLDARAVPAADLSALWAVVLDRLRQMRVVRVAGLLQNDWLAGYLEAWGFQRLCRVITLEFDPAPLDMPAIPPGLHLRPARQADLRAVAVLDNRAFAAPWQLSEASLRQAWEWAEYTAVLETDAGELVGYTLSTGSGAGGHLSRLAVLPGWQGRGLGRLLVHDVLRFFARRQAPWVTVNTQDDNLASQRLYYGLGFRSTGDQHPVWQLDLTQ